MYEDSRYITLSPGLSYYSLRSQNQVLDQHNDDHDVKMGDCTNRNSSENKETTPPLYSEKMVMFACQCHYVLSMNLKTICSPQAVKVGKNYLTIFSLTSCCRIEERASSATNENRHPSRAPRTRDPENKHLT